MNVFRDTSHPGWQRVLELEEFLIETRDKLIGISQHISSPEGKDFDCAEAFKQLALRCQEKINS